MQLTRVVRLAAAVAVLAIAPAGCGDDGAAAERPAAQTTSSAGSGNDRATLDDYVRDMEAALGPVFSAREDYAGAQTAAAARGPLERLVTAYREGADKLARARPPASVAPANERMQALLRDLAGDLAPIMQADRLDTAAAQDVVIRTFELEKLSNDVYTLPR